MLTLEEAYKQDPSIGRQRLMKATGLSEKTCRKFLSSKRIHHDDVVALKAKKEESDLKRKYKSALSELDALKNANSIRESILATKAHSIIIRGQKTSSEATACAVASDWHIGEVVDPEVVSWTNTYNRDVAISSVQQFFANLVKLTDHEAQAIPIHNICINALGDFISGYIHEELQENNHSSPIEECILMRDLWHSGINYILNNTDCHLQIVCCFGNHGRTTQKKRISTAAANSYEWLVYQNLIKDFAHQLRVSISAPKGYFNIYKLYDFTIRAHHGDAIKSCGGIGGITIPIKRKIAQWNASRRVDLDVMGHFHQKLDGGRFLVNGSLIGYNAYAIDIGAEEEKPQQMFFLIDKEHGKTKVAPIFIERDLKRLDHGAKGNQS